MAKPKTNAWYRKKACELAKKIVRTEANFTCAYCGKREPNVKTHGSHVYGENTYRNMSADTENIICLCYTHHIGGYMATKEPSWHKNPLEMVEWFNTKYPDKAQRLRLLSQDVFRKVDFEKKYEELKARLAAIEARHR